MEYLISSNTSFLSCPVIRAAVPGDASEIAEMVIRSHSDFSDSVFKGDIQGGFKVLKCQFSQYNEGIYVLTEGQKIAGVMKLHLPNQLIGNTISYRQLVASLGLSGGIRAGILLSMWDEYRVDPHEAYIEYIYAHEEFDEYSVKEFLLQKAYEMAIQMNAKYVTHFVPVRDYRSRYLFENEGFIFRRKIRSPVAKLLGSKHSVWYRATFNLTSSPITVREYVVEKIDNVKQIWQRNRREILAATRLTIALTIIPVVAGAFAYFGGYPLAVAFWAIIGSFHLLGAKLYLSGSSIGRYGLAFAMMTEGINLITRLIKATSWFDRTWLLPTALLTFWISSVMIRYPVKSGKRVKSLV